MRTILFYIFYITTGAFAMLPLKAIYGISDLAYFFTYYIFRYRRKTVAVNLRNSFPEKSLKELKRIEKDFYAHFCDLFIETIYLLHISKERSLKMLKFSNIEILKDCFPKGKSVIVATGHYSNWEVLNQFAYYLDHKVIGIYKPIENKRFEKFLNDFREKFGAIAVPMQDTFRTVVSCQQNNELFFLGLISDQTPAKSEIRYWTTFLNQETPVFLGVEKIAMKTNQPVFFCNLRKVSRGKYEADIELLCENPKETKPYEITEMHVRALEKLIHKAPENWLWSHRRWKYKRDTIQN
ncbi:MAG: lysophospholipid acyltransferase family protein [Tenuifilaceae bacterium]